MPVYHIQSPVEVLDQMLSKYDPEVVGVGGLLLIKSRNERRERLENLFRRYSSEVLFHGFGIADSNLCRWPWHSVDSSSWIQSPRKYGSVLTPLGSESMPRYWSAQQGMQASVEYLVSLETCYDGDVQTRFVI